VREAYAREELTRRCFLLLSVSFPINLSFSYRHSAPDKMSSPESAITTTETHLTTHS